jgi:predicted alpha/beta hydrolase family esterase
VDEAKRSTRRLWVEDGEIFPSPHDAGSPAGFQRLALLVHGFNNDRQDAERNYLYAKSRLAGAGVAPHVVKNIWELFWPSYVPALMPRLFRIGTKGERAAQGNKAVSAFSYAQQVTKAKRVATRLASYLVAISERTSGPMALVLVGHSLGCRLILEAVEAIERIESGKKPYVAALFLMAAAVQVDRVRAPRRKKEKGSRARDRFHLPDNTYCLYSRDDQVLRFLFPLGQAAAREWRSLAARPEAVGRFGGPVDARWAGKDDTLLGHGMYWQSEATTRHLASLFGVALPNILPRWPGTSLNTLDVRETPVSRTDL